MTHQSQLSQFLRSEAGFRFYKIKIANWGNTVVMVKGSYVNKKTFSTGAVSAAIVAADGFFGVETFRNTQNLGCAGLELMWRWGRCRPVTLSLSYNGEFGSEYWSQEGMLRLSVEF